MGMADTAEEMSGPAPHDDYWYQAVGATAGMRVNTRTVRQLAVVFACVAKKGSTLAPLTLKLVARSDGGEVTQKPNHPIAYLLNVCPNPWQTPYEFKQQMQMWVELYGNGCAEIKPGPLGAVSELHPMHPSRVTIQRLMGSGKFRYQYNDPLTNTTRVLLQDEVFHLRDQCDEVGIGMSRISASATTFGLALAQQDSALQFIRNDSRPAVVATGTDFETKEDEAAYVKAWQAGQTGKNRGKIAVMPPGVDIKTLSITPSDAQALEGMRYSDQQICSLFNLFPHLVGVDAGKSATFNSTEQFNLMHVQQCVRPMARMWEEAIKRDLILGDYFAEFDLTELLKGDTLSEAALVMDMIQSSVFNPDEGRARFGMNAIPGGLGEVFWNQGNWTPLSQTERGSSNGGGSQGKTRSRQQIDRRGGTVDDSKTSD